MFTDLRVKTKVNESCSDSFLAVRLQTMPSFAVNNNISIIYHAKLRFQIRNGHEKGLQLIGVSRKWHTIFLSGCSNRENESHTSEIHFRKSQVTRILYREMLSKHLTIWNFWIMSVKSSKINKLLIYFGPFRNFFLIKQFSSIFLRNSTDLWLVALELG